MVVCVAGAVVFAERTGESACANRCDKRYQPPTPPTAARPTSPAAKTRRVMEPPSPRLAGDCLRGAGFGVFFLPFWRRSTGASGRSSDGRAGSSGTGSVVKTLGGAAAWVALATTGGADATATRCPSD